MRVNDWQVLAHPALLDQLVKLIAAVADAQTNDPDTYRSNPNTKVLAALTKLMFTDIPSDPSRSEYRQGDTLGKQHKHWFRAKFGNGRFRLFFRYSEKHKIIIFAWVNDENSLRTYGARTDAYAVFKKRLKDDNPPDGWDDLFKDSAPLTGVIAQIADEA